MKINVESTMEQIESFGGGLLLAAILIYTLWIFKAFLGRFFHI
jgi:hypothetical protein